MLLDGFWLHFRLQSTAQPSPPFISNAFQRASEFDPPTLHKRKNDSLLAVFFLSWTIGGGSDPQGIGVSENVRWTFEQPMVEAGLNEAGERPGARAPSGAKQRNPPTLHQSRKCKCTSFFHCKPLIFKGFRIFGKSDFLSVFGNKSAYFLITPWLHFCNQSSASSIFLYLSSSELLS